MVNSLKRGLKNMGIDFSNVFIELFSMSSKFSSIEPNGDLTNLKIIYDNILYELTAKKTKSILESALESKIDVPYSCQGGVCSSCIARVKNGKAEMKTNQILTNEELEEGLILTCQANSVSNEIIVDYDDV